MNNHIHPVLYDFYRTLKRNFEAEMVHRRRRKSTICIEIVFHNKLFTSWTGRLNTLKEAEACGFSVICRRQTKKGRDTWHGLTVFQLFLAPVHPQKRREAAPAEDITFEPITAYTHRTRFPARIRPKQKNRQRLAHIKKKQYLRTPPWFARRDTPHAPIPPKGKHTLSEGFRGCILPYYPLAP